MGHQVKSLDAQRINDAQKKLGWAIKNLDFSIKCMVINYKGGKYKVQFFTWEIDQLREWDSAFLKSGSRIPTQEIMIS
jgi:hypothetical protein